VGEILVPMLIREEMDDGETEGGSASDAVLECPALPPPHSCLIVCNKDRLLTDVFFGSMLANDCGNRNIVCAPARSRK
jgi:hypothetical protein